MLHVREHVSSGCLRICFISPVGLKGNVSLLDFRVPKQMEVSHLMCRWLALIILLAHGSRPFPRLFECLSEQNKSLGGSCLNSAREQGSNPPLIYHVFWLLSYLQYGCISDGTPKKGLERCPKRNYPLGVTPQQPTTKS